MDRLVRALRFLFLLAVHPLFLVIGFRHGGGEAIAVWLALAAVTLLLVYAAERTTMNDTFFSAAFREDLTRLNAAFARRNRSRCPALNGHERRET